MQFLVEDVTPQVVTERARSRCILMDHHGNQRGARKVRRAAFYTEAFFKTLRKREWVGEERE